MNLQEIRKLPPEEAITVLTDHLAGNPADDEALTARGLCHWALSRRAEAIRDYLEAIRINPQSRAVQALRVAQEILDFRNTDLINP